MDGQESLAPLVAMLQNNNHFLVSHLVTKETVRCIPQQSILVGVARGGVARCG